MRAADSARMSTSSSFLGAFRPCTRASLDARFERLELRITENVALDESADQLVD